MTPVVPANYPPPFDPADYVKRPDGPADLRIECGVAIVGAGPAGLACAIRLGQLLGDDPATLEQLGEVPIIVFEKGKAPGSHELSGAVVNPSALRELFPDTPLEQLPTYGPVTGEGVYFMTRGRAQRLPTPPPFHNKGNWIFSLSRLTRWMGERAEELGTFVQPETTALRLLTAKGSGAICGVQTAPMGLDRSGKASASAAPPTEIVAKATVLAEGTQGHLRGVALDHFGVGSRFPQAYEIGVKEVWKVAKPLDRIIHTLGWPLRWSGKYGEVGGSFIYPMGPEHLCVGFVLGLEYTDSGLSPHDILQEFKTHGFVRKLLEGGERVAWGAKTIPSGGYYSIPDTLALPGAVLTGDSAGLVNIPRLKGVHYAMHSGIHAAEAIHGALKAGADLSQADALAGYDTAVRQGRIGKDLHRYRNLRQALSRGLVTGSQIAGLMDLTRGVFPGGAWGHHADAEHDMEARGRRLVEPDGKLTFDKLSSVFLSGNRTRDDQPNHVRIQARVPAELARTWVNMCPAAVYEVAVVSVAGGFTTCWMLRTAVT